MEFHKIEINELFEKLKSSKKGLSSEEAELRINDYGHNILEVNKKNPAWLKFLKQFTNFFASLLIFGAILAFIADRLDPGQGNIYISIALAIVVLLNAIFTFIQDYQSEKIMDSFNKMIPNIVEVLRDGRKTHIHASELVPGDIIFLAEGDKIPADGRLIEHGGMKVDNSSITGESEPQLRKLECTHENMMESRNMVFSGTLVQTGNGKAIVCSTGMNTEIGKIVKLTKETKEVDTPLHKELKHFIKIISSIAIVLGTIFFVISKFLGQDSIGSLIFAIGIIVANVPEGLLPTVTLSLSMAAKRMAKKNALIKNLESVETLGSTTIICTDKTGTLTENKMSINTLFIDGEESNVEEKGVLKNKHLLPMIETMVLCNNSHLDENKQYTGDPTETALLQFAEKCTNIKKILQLKRIHETPFDSKTKRMITTNIKGNYKIAYMKGAPEIVIEKCNKIFDKGKIRKLMPKDKQIITKFYKKLASRGERVLAYSYKKTNSEKAKESNFIFVGLTGMIDPPKKEVKESIKKCKTAGIKVIMVTGDYSLTAEAIGRKVGLIENSNKANIMSGDELEKISEEELKLFLKKDNLIFARTKPAQKMQIVKALQSLGEVVTVTGDGVNDAPALKNADMGVAMGLGGTEVAREAADMVLMDDNFATIVTAIEEGRTIYSNIKKFIAYILTSNIPEILPFIAFVLLQIPLPLTVILILSIDLGTDLIPALGLGSEKPESDVMHSPPRNRNERLLSKKLLFISYGIIGVIQAAAGFFAYFFVLIKGGWTWDIGMDIMRKTNALHGLYLKAITAFFAAVIIAQIADVFICRTRRQSIFKIGFFTNKTINLGIVTEIALLLIIVYAPWAHPFFGTNPLKWYELLLGIPFAITIIIWNEIRTYLVRKGNTFFEKYLTW